MIKKINIRRVLCKLFRNMGFIRKKDPLNIKESFVKGGQWRTSIQYCISILYLFSIQ